MAETASVSCIETPRERRRPWHARAIERSLLCASLAFAGCDDADVRVCYGPEDFCSAVFAANHPPQANAGADRDAIAGTRVILDGGASSDGDGSISAWAWVQTAGPSVAITNGGTDRPEFVAPDVEVGTDLAFELTVTDDDNASDTDSVTVTVVPTRTAAIEAGVALLKHLHRPAAIAQSVPQQATRIEIDAFVGLWFGARIRAANAGFESDVDSLLDEVRVAVELCVGCAAGAITAEPPTPLHLGLRDVAEFTMQRDPATFARARALLPPAAAGGVPDATWLEAIDRATPRLAVPARQHAPLADRAEALLLAASAETPPTEVAAATLVLLVARTDGGGGERATPGRVVTRSAASRDPSTR